MNSEVRHRATQMRTRRRQREPRSRRVPFYHPEILTTTTMPTKPFPLPRRRLMHYTCPTCKRRWSEPMLLIDLSSRDDFTDGKLALTCNECEAERVARIRASGYRPSREACDRMIAECVIAKPATKAKRP